MSTMEHLPVICRPTLAGRRAATLAWDASHPRDPAAGLVCVYDQDEAVEDRRSKEISGTVRVRRYAWKNALLTDVAVRYEDGGLEWYGTPQTPPVPTPRIAGILRRRHRGSGPSSGGGGAPPPVYAGTIPRRHGLPGRDGAKPPTATSRETAVSNLSQLGSARSGA